jgi:hypothetical protein
MDGYNGDTVRVVSNIDTTVREESQEANHFELGIKGFVPLASGLWETIEGFVESPHTGSAVRKTFRLFHI